MLGKGSLGNGKIKKESNMQISKQINIKQKHQEFVGNYVVVQIKTKYISIGLYDMQLSYCVNVVRSIFTNFNLIHSLYSRIVNLTRAKVIHNIFMYSIHNIKRIYLKECNCNFLSSINDLVKSPNLCYCRYIHPNIILLHTRSL